MSLFEVNGHDPGGKSTFALPAGVRGHAEFYGKDDCYRPLLTRDWGPSNSPYALWIGMNPSTARADVNDPTIARECNITAKLLNLSSYHKCNVCDWRATDPRRLIPLGDRARSDINLDVIREQASRAFVVVLTCGQLPRSLQHLARETISVLRMDRRVLYCLGRTQDGWPRHTRGIPNTVTLERF